MGTKQIQNGYENANGTCTEWIQNRYRTDIERISNGYRTVTDPFRKKEKKRSGTQTIREHVLQNTC